MLSHWDLPINGVDLPNASHLISLRDAAREGAIHIYVTRDSRLYFNDLQISPGELSGKIQDSLRHGSRPTVFISVDHHAKYASVSSTLDSIYSAGITRIAFVAESR